MRSPPRPNRNGITGAKVKGLTYTYDTDPFNKAVCVNLVAQWFKNLGVTVKCVEVDRKTFFDKRNGKCAYPLFRQSWDADYDNPQNWFDYLFVSINSAGSCYSNPLFDNAVKAADQALASALADYKGAGQTLMEHIVFADLVYGVQQYLRNIVGRRVSAAMRSTTSRGPTRGSSSTSRIWINRPHGAVLPM